MPAILTIVLAIIALPMIIKAMVTKIREDSYKSKEAQYKLLKSEVLKKLGFTGWEEIPYFDDITVVPFSTETECCTLLRS